MRILEDALKLTDTKQLLREINERKHLGQNGTSIYPKNIVDEINLLSARISKLKNDKAK